MTQRHDPSLDLDDELRALLPKRRVPWGSIVVIALVLVLIAGVIALYRAMPQRGVTLAGDGYVVVLPDGDTWLLMTQGAEIETTPASATRFGLRTGPCRNLEGSVVYEQHQLEVEKADCDPAGAIVPAMVSRMHWLGARFGYWGDGVQPLGGSLEEALRQTPEVVLAMMDPRADDPQLIPLYTPLFPENLKAARGKGVPPPVIVGVHRNDLLLSRMNGTTLADFLHRDRFVFAGAGVSGGWLVRELVVVPEGTPSLERLLVAPDEPPWPRLMGERTLHVARRERAGGR